MILWPLPTSPTDRSRHQLARSSLPPDLGVERFSVKLRRDASPWGGFDKATLSRCFVDSILVV